MRLSVIIVGYNAENYLANCLQSVFDQSLPADDYEVIYVDNHSRDQSVALVHEQFPTVTVLARSDNAGYYGGFNWAAAETAQGDYLLALPQDTVLHHDCLRELVQAADDDPQLMVGLVNTINPNAPEYGAQDRQARPDHVYWCATNRFGQTNLVQYPFFETPRSILAYSGVAALIRRSAQDDLLGYFDERLSHLVGDSELGIRANVLGYACKIVPTAVVFHIEDNKQFNNPGFLRNAFEGARDSVVIYLKLMNLWEFVLFAPLLLIGQASKVFTLRFPVWQRALLFIPASGLSPVTFALALRRAPTFAADRRVLLARRPGGYFRLLSLIVRRALG